MHSKRILVYGWFGKLNYGDDMFTIAAREVVGRDSSHILTFSSVIPSDVNLSYDAVIFAGGSYLDQRVMNIEKVQIPMAFLGVGLPVNVPKENLDALRRAEVVYVRSNDSLDFTAPFAPDLVYALRDNEVGFTPDTTGIGSDNINICLNNFMSKPKAEEWHNRSWEWFVSEFAQALNELLLRGYTLTFIPLCTNFEVDDRRSTGAILDRLRIKNDRQVVVINDLSSQGAITERLSRAYANVTMRLHGSVVSEMTGVPSIALNVHDKVSSHKRTIMDSENLIPYYGFLKGHLLDRIKALEDFEYRTSLFTKYQSYATGACDKWKDLYESIRTKLSL